MNYITCKISPLCFLWHLTNPGSLFVSIHITFPSQSNRLQPLIATRSKPSRRFQLKSINVSELFKRSDWGKQNFHSLMDLMEQIPIENNVFNRTYSPSRETGIIAEGDWTNYLDSSRNIFTRRQWQGLWQLWHGLNIFCCFSWLIIIQSIPRRGANWKDNAGTGHEMLWLIKSSSQCASGGQ